MGYNRWSKIALFFAFYLQVFVAGGKKRERVPLADPNELRTSDLLLGTKLKSASHISTEP